MAALREASAILPNGEYFDTWEVEQVYDRELHVDCGNPAASDENDGSAAHPFKTIGAAAAIAEPGTRVLIHAGTYRETVKPARGGESPERMIAYEAAGDGDAIIKASVIATEFSVSDEWGLYRMTPAPAVEEWPTIWQTKLNPQDFQGYNPFCCVNILHDHMYIEYDKTDMTTYLNRRGMVFVDGKPLQQVPLYTGLAEAPGTYWVEANGQTVHFRLQDDDVPQNHLIELTSREQCFAPDIPYLRYIKVKGLICAHAATGAPVPQRGAISCFRGSHWIIEDCTIDWSNCLGIDVGSECWHRKDHFEPNFGYAILRRNKIYDCGVCGIAGISGKNLLVEDNWIEGTGWQKMELSWEAAGIKVHYCTNSLYRRNVFTKTIRADALWMDVSNENNRITQNLFLDGIDAREAVFVECSRGGENLFDNNIIWNVEGRFDKPLAGQAAGSSGWYSLEDQSELNGYGFYGEGTDYLRFTNNLIGKCRSSGSFMRPTPFRLAGRGGTSRDAKYYNNLFFDCGEASIKMPTEKNISEGNAFVRMPYGHLRILFPQPAECLDLQTWQEFHGFDLTGVEADFNIDVDTDALTMTVSLGEKPMSAYLARFVKDHLTNPAELPRVKADPKVTIDFFGNEIGAEDRIAGPFTALADGVTISIDPRKLN